MASHHHSLPTLYLCILTPFKPPALVASHHCTLPTLYLCILTPFKPTILVASHHGWGGKGRTGERRGVNGYSRPLFTDSWIDSWMNSRIHCLCSLHSPSLPVCSITTVCDHQSFFHHSSWRFKGSEDAKVQCREGAMVGVYKCGRFKGSEEAKVQCWEVR